jgi:hypothetical protein
MSTEDINVVQIEHPADQFESDMLQGQSIDYSREPDANKLRAQLRSTLTKFKAAGGRGVERAEEIDCRRYDLERRRR